MLFFGADHCFVGIKSQKTSCDTVNNCLYAVDELAYIIIYNEVANDNAFPRGGKIQAERKASVLSYSRAHLSYGEPTTKKSELILAQISSN